MIKNKNIVIRIDLDIKEKLKIKSKQLGLPISSYIRMLILKDLS